MADSLDLSQLHGFLIDPENAPRKILRSVLVRMGIINLTELDGATAAREAFATNVPDFIFVDADAGDGELLRFIGALRHNAFPTNPFVPVVAMTSQPTQPLMIRFTGSGADDLMVKPFSTKQVQERISNLIDARKSFVVTSDYIGPDRRKSPREGVQIPLFDVPNTLRMKALGNYDRSRISDMISGSVRAINEQKVIRQGFQAAFLVEFAIPGVCHSDPPQRQAVDHLLRVPAVVEDIVRRLPPNVEGRAMADTYARAMLMQIDQFKVDTAKPMTDGPVLRRAAFGLAAMAARRMDLAALEGEIKGAVGAYRARLDQLSQAKAAAAATPAKS
jgi:CheY-like chemotaxis protein